MSPALGVNETGRPIDLRRKATYGYLHDKNYFLMYRKICIIIEFILQKIINKIIVICVGWKAKVMLHNLITSRVIRNPPTSNWCISSCLWYLTRHVNKIKKLKILTVAILLCGRGSRSLSTWRPLQQPNFKQLIRYTTGQKFGITRLKQTLSWNRLCVLNPQEIPKQKGHLGRFVQNLFTHPTSTGLRA